MPVLASAADATHSGDEATELTAARDGQRARVYAAEVAAFTDTLVDESIGIDGLNTLAGIFFHEPWWVSATGGAMPSVVAARADAGRSVAACGPDGSWTIRIAPRHDQAPTLSHEAAHVLCGITFTGPICRPAAHGREFRAAHLAVCAVLMGSHGAKMLADAYQVARLDWFSAPPWAKPPRAEEHGIVGRWRTAIAL